MSKIYLVSRKQGTIGVNYDEKLNSAKLIKIKADTTLGYSETGIDAVVRILEAANVEEMTEVNTIYVTTRVLETLTNQFYKFWLLSGTNRNGEAIDERVLNLYRRLNEQLKIKGDYFVFRSIAKCKINDKVKANPNSLAKFDRDSQVNDYYARYCIEKANEEFPNDIASFVPDVTA